MKSVALVTVTCTALSWMLPVAAPQAVPAAPAPWLTMSFPYRKSDGSTLIWLKCSPPEGWRAEMFYFYWTSAHREWTQLAQRDINLLELSTHYLTKQAFACSYLEGETARRSQFSNVVVFSPSESPPPATLSLDPRFPFYIPGEEATLTCSAAEAWKVRSYTFYKRRPGQPPLRLPRQGTGPAERLRVEEGSAAWYSCTYWVLSRGGNEIQAQESNTLFVGVRKTPAAANLSVSPGYSVYIRGENVTLMCSAPTKVDVARYTFYRTEDQVAKELQRNQTGPSETFRVGETAAGNYSCAYWLLTSGRELESSWSSFVSIAWTDPPPPPALSVDPPSGELREGDRLLISCSANGSSTERRFRLFKDGAEMASSSEDSLGSSRELRNASTALHILQAELCHTGEFACRYEENVSGRWILSPWSQKVAITVSAKWTLEYLCFALVPLLLIIPLGVCFWRKRNGTKQKPEPGKPAEDMQGPLSVGLPGQGSEVTYALLSFPATAAHSGREGESRLHIPQTRKVVYSEVRLPPGNRAAK